MSCECLLLTGHVNMRVGVFLGNHKPEIGGSFSFQDSLVQALNLVSTEHVFFVFSYSSVEFTKDNVHFISLCDKSLISRCFSFFKFHVLKRLATYKRLNIYCKKYSLELVWFMTQAYEPVNIPYIYTVFDLEHRLQPFFPEVGNQEIWHDRESNFSSIIPRATYIISGTEAGKKQIVDFYNPEADRIKVIPFPVPVFTMSDLSRDLGVLTKYSIDREYLFYPAQFWPHKNHTCLLNALKILVEVHSFDMLLVFTGSDKGNMSFIRQQAIDLGIANRVLFIGFVSNEELAVLYQNAFALLYASLFGPDNLPPLEAFALGCPVIATNVAGAIEQMGDAALLVEPCNEHDFSNAVIKLKMNPALRDELIEKGRKRACRWTTIDYVTEVTRLINDFQQYRRCWSSNDEYIIK